MIESGIFLFLCALLTLPSLISHKKDVGREILAKVIFVQGVIGAAILIVALVFAINVGIAGAPAVIKDRGIIYWLTLLASDIIAMCLGFILSFGLVRKLISLRASFEARERSEGLFYKLVEFQTAVGFFCLILGIWDIVYATLLYPLVRLELPL